MISASTPGGMMKYKAIVMYWITDSIYRLYGIIIIDAMNMIGSMEFNYDAVSVSVMHVNFIIFKGAFGRLHVFISDQDLVEFSGITPEPGFFGLTIHDFLPAVEFVEIVGYEHLPFMIRAV
ncbi:MAG TPA: hypothetical protein ENH25_01975 [candidate division Zixibacteria bacterium]|nr:hypothetical protein [candidate division Zixibacteria bacterium]